MNVPHIRRPRHRLRHAVLGAAAVLGTVIAAAAQQIAPANAAPAPAPAAATATQQFSVLGGQLTGRYRLAEHPRPGAPILVLIHGGGEGSEYYDAPGHSVLDLAARSGYSAFALDRPGYHGSASLGFPSDSDHGLFDATAARLDDAITEIWRTHGGSASGVVVHGSSIGGAIALTLASRWSAEHARGEQHWPLLGLAVTDVAQQPQPWAVTAWRATPPVQTFTIGGLSAPRPELLEIVGGWTENWSRIASSITVPVHYRLAQFDELWISRPDLIDQFAAALRTSSPSVDAATTADAFHPIGNSPAADSYNAQFVQFVGRFG
ncbi:alpha/beta hydrolase family protein [Nocardia nova SH22a]|uniref:Alpha/beta hydrolase family protein n=1 Tax=Nocardia nova SH22a TaxID=1415166 RepID=W5TMV5_9NOCA|nr:alpha/beta fold hydrolase [Nocardia nova]AHH18571.1 alpha/beta hydrolase family protein [Nocardia nova SH22a]